jgi:hypothetical protein
MLDHVHRCTYLEKGLYWCFECQRPEHFAPYQCKRCEGPSHQPGYLMSKMRRALRSLSTRSSKKVSRTLETLSHATSFSEKRQKQPANTDADREHDEDLPSYWNIDGAQVNFNELEGTEISTSELPCQWIEAAELPASAEPNFCMQRLPSSVSSEDDMRFESIHTRDHDSYLTSINSPPIETIHPVSIPTNDFQTPSTMSTVYPTPVSASSVSPWSSFSDSSLTDNSETARSCSAQSIFSSIDMISVTPSTSRDGSISSIEYASANLSSSDIAKDAPRIFSDMPLFEEPCSEDESSDIDDSSPVVHYRPNLGRNHQTHNCPSVSSSIAASRNEVNNIGHKFALAIDRHAPKSLNQIRALPVGPVMRDLLALSSVSIAEIGIRTWQRILAGHAQGTITELFSATLVAHASAIAIYHKVSENQSQILFDHSVALGEVALSAEESRIFEDFARCVWLPTRGSNDLGVRRPAAMRARAGNEVNQIYSTPRRRVSYFSPDDLYQLRSVSESSSSDEVRAILPFAVLIKSNKVVRLVSHFLDRKSPLDH